MEGHRDDCDCAFCFFPSLNDSLVEDTAPMRLMETYVNSVKADEEFFRASQPKRAHWASGSFSKCDRKLWFQNNGTLPTDVGFSDENMQLGNDIEDHTVELYRNWGEFSGKRVLVGRQFPAALMEARLKWPITGKTDFFILEDDKWVIVEVKSTKDFGGDGRYCSGCRKYTPGDADAWYRFKPSREHVAQLTIYLAAYRGMVIRGTPVAPYGYLHYRNRNTGAHLRYRYTFNEEFYEAILDEYARQEREVLSLKVAPSVLSTGLKSDRYPCQWTAGDETVRCSFWSLCWASRQKPQVPSS